MKKILQLVCASFLLLFLLNGTGNATQITSASDLSLTGAEVIDFESQTLDKYTVLTIGDVIFTPVGDTTAQTFLRIDDMFVAYSDTRNTTGQYLDNHETGFDKIIFTFDSLVSAFGFNLGANTEDWLLTAYDQYGNMIEEFSMPDTWVNGSSVDSFFGISNDNIAYAVLEQTSTIQYPTDWIVIDNFSYKTVPEPSTILLFGIGLLSLARVSRKK